MSEKLDAYREFQLSIMEHAHSYKDDMLSYKSFCRLWLRDFKWLKLRKHKTIKSKCTVCEDLEVCTKGFSRPPSTSGLILPSSTQ